MEERLVETVFDVFDEVPYEFLLISRGGVYGNQITTTHSATGVFKLRNDMVMVNNQEVRQSAATLHVHEYETFMSSSVVGQGVRVDGQDYEIIGQTGGDNYADGSREHYRLTLQNSDFSDLEETS
jgi:hypothetical protein